jgi:hypothetical protein
MIGILAVLGEYVALGRNPSIDTLAVTGMTAAAVVFMIGLTFIAGRLIYDAYVTTVVRMEALAAGDLTSPILHTTNRDCVSRTTTAMAMFRRNREEASGGGTARDFRGAGPAARTARRRRSALPHRNPLSPILSHCAAITTR